MSAAAAAAATAAATAAVTTCTPRRPTHLPTPQGVQQVEEQGVAERDWRLSGIIANMQAKLATLWPQGIDATTTLRWIDSDAAVASKASAVVSLSTSGDVVQGKAKRYVRRWCRSFVGGNVFTSAPSVASCRVRSRFG